MEPAVLEDQRGLFGVAPVALHDLGALDDQLAHFAGGEFPGAGLRVHHLGPGAGHGHAHAAGRPLAPDGVEMGHGGGLGQAVALQHGAAAERLEAVPYFQGQGRGAADAGPEGGQVELGQARVVDQGHKEGGDPGQHGGPVLLHGLEEAVDFKAGQDDDHGPLGHGPVETGGEPEGVGKGEQAHEAFGAVLYLGQPGVDLGHVGHEVAVG